MVRPENLDDIFDHLQTQYENVIEPILSSGQKSERKESDERNWLKLYNFIDHLMESNETRFLPEEIPQDFFPEKASMVKTSSKFYETYDKQTKEVIITTVIDTYLNNLQRILNKKMERATQDNIPKISQVWLKYFKYQAIIKAFREIYNFKNSEKGLSSAIVRITNNVLSLFEAVNIVLGSSADIVVISVGSAGEDIQQKRPDFLKELAQTKKVDVINIDPNFDKSGFVDHLSDKNVYVYEYRATFEDALPLCRTLQSDLNNANHFLIQTLDYFLKSTQKKVILIENRTPQMGNFFSTIGTLHADKMGNQLEIIGSYFKNCPVFIYNKALFKSYNTKEKLNEVLLPAWGKWRDKYNRDKDDYIIDDREFAGWKKEYFEMGQLFRTLSNIKKTDLFKNELMDSEQEKQEKLKIILDPKKWHPQYRDTFFPMIQSLLKDPEVVIIISIGSEGNDEAQRCPKFAKELSQKHNVYVFNIDPKFPQNTFPENNLKQNLNVFLLSGGFKSTKELSEIYSKYHKPEQFLDLTIALQIMMDYLLTYGKNSKIIIMDNISTTLQASIYECAFQHKGLIGTRLEIVTAGGMFDFPAFIYSPYIFNYPYSDPRSNDFLDKTISAFSEMCQGKYDKEKRLAGSYYWSYGTDLGIDHKKIMEAVEKNIQQWQKKFQELGQLSRNLNSIEASDLFPLKPRRAPKI